MVHVACVAGVKGEGMKDEEPFWSPEPPVPLSRRGPSPDFFLFSFSVYLLQPVETDRKPFCLFWWQRKHGKSS